MKNLLKITLIISTFFIISCGNETKNESDNNDSIKKEQPIKKDIMEKAKVRIGKVESRNLLSIRKKIQWKDAGKEMGAMYGSIMAYIKENKLTSVAAPISLAHAWDKDGGDIECGIYIKEETKGNENIKFSKSYGGKVAVIVHKGSYHKSSETWSKLFKYIDNNKLEKNGTPWEEYITDPAVVKNEDEYLTNLYQPIK